MRTTTTVRRLALCATLASSLAMTTCQSADASAPMGDIDGGYSVDLGGGGRTTARLVVPAADCVTPGTIVALSQALHHQANGSVTVGGVSYSGCAPDGAGGFVEEYYSMLLGSSGVQIIDRPVAPHDVILVKVNAIDGTATVVVKNLTAGWHRRDTGPVPPSELYTVGVDTTNGGRKTSIHIRDNRINGIALSEAGATPNPPADPCGSLSEIRQQVNFSVSVICS